MIRQILEYIPNEKIKFGKTKDGDTIIMFETRKSLFTILPSNTWLEIKRIIDSKISDKKSDECNICCSNKLIHITRVSCCRCSESWCIGCNTKLFVVNKGLAVCPYCKYTFGQVVPNHILQLGVYEVLSRYKTKIQKKIIKYLE